MTPICRSEPSTRPLPRLTPALALCAAACLTALLAASAAAQDDPPLGWSDRAELSLVAVDGNAESQSFGFSNALDYHWPEATFSFDVHGVRAESTTVTLTAVGTEDSFVVEEESDTDLTAENYHAKLRYERDVTEQLFWHVGAGWEQDEFAGVDQRLSAVAGAGYVVWRVEDERLFKVDAGLTYTQEEVVVLEEDDESFLGLRVSWEWLRRLTESTRIGNDTTIDQNLDDTSDLRADTTAWVSVKMSERLSLKSSLQLKYDAEPAFTAIDLFDAGGDDTEIDVVTQLDELDTIFKVALVIDF